MTTTTTTFNTSHDRREHFELGNVNEWSQADRIASRDTCAMCRIIFRDNGEFRAATPDIYEFNTPTRQTSVPVPQGGSYNNGGRVDKPASEKQVAFLGKLLAEKEHPYGAPDLTQVTSRGASAMIDALLAAPRKQVARLAAALSTVVTEDGMYQLASGDIFKVQIAKNGSGNLYAKELIIDVPAEVVDGKIVTPAETHFEYAPGAIRRLSPADKMSKEQAAAFGALYGVCCVCSRDLTDEGSIAAGIGPICAQNF